MGRLEGQVAVVPGASRGIGEAIALAFAQQGATVVLSSRKQRGLDEAADRIQAAVPGATLDPRALHVGHLEAIQPWWDAVQAAHGLPRVLVNNAGTNPYFGPMLGLEWAAWDKTFEVNLKGPFEMSRQLAQRHVDVRPGQPASIISIASILGQIASPLQGIYGMTKAALISLTQTLALELGETGIRVNAIAPGLVDTKLASAITHDPALLEQMIGRTALKRIAQPGEIAGLAVFLASDESAYLTGQTITIDGGHTIT